MKDKLQTKYKIRAAIPGTLVERTGIKDRAQKLGVQLAVDDSGNVEGAWDASLLTLDAVMEMLSQLGLRDLMIQKSAISFTVAVGKNCSRRVWEAVRGEIGKDPDSCPDVLTDNTIFRFVAPCERAVSVAAVLNGLGVSIIIAHESYEIEKTNV